MAVYLLGMSLYALNCVVGLAAQFRGTKFGVWHHVLYAGVFAAAGAAAWVNFRWPLLVTLGALAAFPLARPRTRSHPTLAVVGLLGYLGGFFV